MDSRRFGNEKGNRRPIPRRRRHSTSFGSRTSDKPRPPMSYAAFFPPNCCNPSQRRTIFAGGGLRVSICYSPGENHVSQ
jgi:hypothetical protein